MNIAILWGFIFVACLGLCVKEFNLLYWFLALYSYLVLIFQVSKIENDTDLQVWFVAFSTEHGGVGSTFVELPATELRRSDVKQIEEHIAIEMNVHWVSVLTYKRVERD